jgi:hypothetical protein
MQQDELNAKTDLNSGPAPTRAEFLGLRAQVAARIPKNPSVYTQTAEPDRLPAAAQATNRETNVNDTTGDLFDMAALQKCTQAAAEGPPAVSKINEGAMALHRAADKLDAFATALDALEEGPHEDDIEMLRDLARHMRGEHCPCCLPILGYYITKAYEIPVGCLGLDKSQWEELCGILNTAETALWSLISVAVWLPKHRPLGPDQPEAASDYIRAVLNDLRSRGCKW